MSRAVQNITVDPLSRAMPVEDPEIKEVLDCATGEYLDAPTWIGDWRYEELIQQRLDIREKLKKAPRFRCPLCSVPVYLVSNQHKRFHFKHLVEDGSCPAQTRHPLSREDILARKYRGLRESEPHRRIKELIARSLSADPQYSVPKKERQWRSAHDPIARRQPDVQATSPRGRFAFEVQLSTTFLDVVVGRREFYREEGGLLVWVMGGFDPEYRRLTTDDLLFSNNSNILIVDEETTALSESTGQFRVRCHFRRPARDGDQLSDTWESCIAPFDALTLEQEAQRCWYFDYESEATAIRAEINAERRARESDAATALRTALFDFWTDRKPNTAPDAKMLNGWRGLRRAFADRGIALPASSEDNNLMALMNGLTSAREGKPVGWKFKQLVEVGHRIAEAYPQHVVAFGHALLQFDRVDLIKQQDHTGKWGSRTRGIRASLSRKTKDYMPDPDTLSLVDFLMPGVGDKIKKLIPATET
ncbi:DUF6035 family protein [Labrys sp. 22185]|uniref:DUF6035 family protein n=1 Tax=Labrys sp. 22185 TaxID=3453888 RepID=UPI003F842B1D